MGNNRKQPEPQSNRVPVILDNRAVITSLIFLIIYGLLFNHYSFAVSDHTYKIPFLKSIFHPNLYARDITVSMKDYYSTYFYIFVWPLERLYGFEPAYFFIYALTQVMFYVSIYLLAVTLFKEKIVGLLSVAFLLFPKEVLGGIFTFDSIVEERTVAVVLILFGIYLLLTHRYIWAAIFLSLSANIHFITFINQCICLAIALLIHHMHSRDKRQFIKRYTPFFLLLILGCSPILIRGFLMSPLSKGLVIVDPVWLKMILMRSTPHFSPDNKQFLYFILEASVVLFLISAFRIHQLKNIRQSIILYVSSIISMCLGFILASVFVKICPVLAGLQLSFLRASYMFEIFFYMFVAYILYTLWQRFIPRKAILHHHNYLLIAVFLIAMINMVVAHRTGIRIDNPFKHNGNPTIDAQLWLKENTPENALILTPPYKKEFRIFSERATLGSWKDWTFNCLSRNFAFSMFERLHDVGGISLNSDISGNEDNIKKYYWGLKEDSLVQIAHKYEIDYVVMEKYNPLNLKKVYENKQYTIYKF
jgi:hypothetical protein